MVLWAVLPVLGGKSFAAETTSSVSGRSKKQSSGGASRLSRTKRPAVAAETPARQIPPAAQIPDIPPALTADQLMTTAPLDGLSLSEPLPSDMGDTSSALFLERIDAALEQVGLGEDPVNLDEPSGLSDPAVASTLAMQNLLPDTPLPLADLDRLTSSSAGASRLSLMEALCRSLESNQQLKVERLRPEVSNTGIESALSEFDTVLRADTGFSARQSSTLGPRARGGVDDRPVDTNVSRSRDAEVSLSGRLPTGTDYSIGYSANRSINNRSEAFYSSALNLNITQNLLQGAGTEVNLVRVKTAQNNFVRSLYTLQQFLNNLVTDVQSAYFDLYLAVETLRIRRQAYDVARQQRQQVEAFVEVGRAAPLEAFAAQAEESSRISGVINAAADLQRQQLELLRLVNPICIPQGWQGRLFPSEPPIVPKEALVAEEHVKLAMRYRPDLRQAEIDLANGELEVVRTENGLLPVLDFVAEGGVTGVGDAFNTANREAAGGEFNNYRLGLQFAYPLQNRAASAAYKRSIFERESAEEAIQNFLQLIQVEVRSAIIEIDRTARLIESTAVTRRLRELEYRAELEKFRVGSSTQVIVNQVLRDLTTSQLDEVSAQVAHMNAYLELYRADGTVLQRRGIQPIHILPTSGVPNP